MLLVMQKIPDNLRRDRWSSNVILQDLLKIHEHGYEISFRIENRSICLTDRRVGGETSSPRMSGWDYPNVARLTSPLEIQVGSRRAVAPQWYQNRQPNKEPHPPIHLNYGVNPAIASTTWIFRGLQKSVLNEIPAQGCLIMCIEMSCSCEWCLFRSTLAEWRIQPCAVVRYKLLGSMLAFWSSQSGM